MVLVEITRLLELPSGFKCTWYGLSHPVQFAVLILMPALLYGVNRLFDRLEKASHARLCPYTPDAYTEERAGGRPEHVEGTVCQQRKLEACPTKGNPRTPLPLRTSLPLGRKREGRGVQRNMSKAHDVNGSWALAPGRASKSLPIESRALCRGWSDSASLIHGMG